jgi:hypothetical protein
MKNLREETERDRPTRNAKLHPHDRWKAVAEAPPRHPPGEALPPLQGESFSLFAGFLTGMIEGARKRALDSEYVNGVLAAFHYLQSSAGEKEAMELLERRRTDR